MADAIKRTVTTVKHEYKLRTPTYAVEVAKAINWASRDYKQHAGINLDMPLPYDDIIKVSADEEEVVVWWEEQ